MPRLRCAAVAGPANNQLDEPATARLLAARGILWAPDVVVSAGEVMTTVAAMDTKTGHGYSRTWPGAKDAHPQAAWGLFWYGLFVLWGLMLGAAVWTRLRSERTR